MYKVYKNDKNITHHEDHAGALLERAAESEKCYYEYETSDDYEKRCGWEIASIQEVREIVIDGVYRRSNGYYHNTRKLHRKKNIYVYNKYLSEFALTKKRYYFKIKNRKIKKADWSIE